MDFAEETSNPTEALEQVVLREVVKVSETEDQFTPPGHTVAATRHE